MIVYNYNNRASGCLPWAILLAVIALLAASVSACDLYVTDSYYLCVVDGDTIHLPGDTTGVRCADVDSLPRF